MNTTKTTKSTRLSYNDLSPSTQKAAISNLLYSNYYAEIVRDLVEYDIKSCLVADCPVDLVDIKVVQTPVKSDARLYKVVVTVDADSREKVAKIFKAVENMIPAESPETFHKRLSLDDFSHPDEVFLLGGFSSSADNEPVINIGYHKDDFETAERVIEPLQDWFSDVCGTITSAMRWHVDDYFCEKWAENIILDKDLKFREDGSLIVPRGYKKELAIPY
jgi:hypothetical protein